MIFFSSLAPQEAVIGIIWDLSHKNIAMGIKAPGNKYFSGKVHIPGEKIDVGESDEAALKRLGWEELTIGITIVRYIVQHINVYERKVRWWECQADSDDLKPGSDLTKVFWVPLLEVPHLHEPETVKRWPEEIKGFFGVS